ncbi:hypothetical protein B0T24DRAFT_598558 [Lasiosphaeria ovina]|uniref:Uncharacterized protein n=1 Tax=Lasiosphaeria ovina TaxID=92902 RepID=A0AAE0JVY0_9PEZI|nr:hypothetical protein B0T24DRAFT_598558 [Lasiosphaeria ovina]
MNGGVTKARTRRATPFKLKRAELELLDAATDRSAELPQSYREQSLVNGSLDRHATPVPTVKRQLDATPENVPLPAKRLTRENLTLFNKMARKKASNKGSTHYDSTDESITTRIISTTSFGFDVRACQNGILDPLSSKPPTNMKSVVEKYAQSPGNEAAFAAEVTEELLKKRRDDGYKRSFN